MSQPSDETVGVGTAYAFGRLRRALRTVTALDPRIVAQAEAKADAWMRTLDGMLSGRLAIGSRTPVRDMPAWVTPQVLTGGFVTGDAVAGGPLKAHEIDLLAQLDEDSAAPSPASPRARLNLFFLSGEGLRLLETLRETGGYRIDVPEEAALLSVGWLLEHDESEKARALIAEIEPWFDRLRFYPAPSEPRDASHTGAGSQAAAEDDVDVHLHTAEVVIGQLRGIREEADRLAQREALAIWGPLFDRLIALFVETVDGPVPTIARARDGRPDRRLSRRADGSWPIEGGWPCQRYAPDWPARAAAWLADYRAARETHRRCREPEHPRRNFARLREVLERLVADRASVDGRLVGRVRLVIAQVASTRGLPDSPEAQARRRREIWQAEALTRQEFGAILAQRLEAATQGRADRGIERALEEALFAPAGTAAERHEQPIPSRLRRYTSRCVDMPLEMLLDTGVVRSAESLATVLPQIAGPAIASGYPDRHLRRLSAAVHDAFDRRRSLLLLNLQSQVRITELPWVAAIDSLRASTPFTRAKAQAQLRRVVRLLLMHFPQTCVPNKAIDALRQLAAHAGLKAPLVSELAVDIFMGAFAAPFLHAAQSAGRMLRGSLYERYYDLPAAEIAALDDVSESRYGTPVSAGFARLCERRADLLPAAPRGLIRLPARAGTVIEQQQILTTQNLAALVEAAGLQPELPTIAADLARRCLVWIRRQQLTSRTGRRRAAVKNAAYAWRQMIFYLSFASTDEARRLVGGVRDGITGGRDPLFDRRFQPAIEGLWRALEGKAAEESGGAAADGTAARRFLGWSVGPHWLLTDPNEPSAR